MGESGAGGFQVSGAVGIYSSESVQIEIFGIINIFNALDYSELAAAQKAAEEREREAAAMAVSPMDDFTAPVTPDPVDTTTEAEDQTIDNQPEPGFDDALGMDLE